MVTVRRPAVIAIDIRYMAPDFAGSDEPTTIGRPVAFDLVDSFSAHLTVTPFPPVEPYPHLRAVDASYTH